MKFLKIIFYLFILIFARNKIFAIDLPKGFSATKLAQVKNATTMAQAPDGRIFILTQSGQIFIYSNDGLLAQPFMAIHVNSEGERGLIGIAFDPAFVKNNFFYLHYTVPIAPIHNRVSRFTAKGNIGDLKSEKIIFEITNESIAPNHHSGAMAFGKDGKLYVAVGENAKPSNSQTLDNLLGKLLRINSDGTIPIDNPFYKTAKGENRAIYALGLRNPFTFSIQPKTGKIFVNDDGQASWEEINEIKAGGNYGWPVAEGNIDDKKYINPVFTYHHTQGNITGCSVIGSTFYNPPVTQFPADYNGKYFFGDYCSGFIKTIDPETKKVEDFASGVKELVNLLTGIDGSLYYLERGEEGGLHKIIYNKP